MIIALSEIYYVEMGSSQGAGDNESGGWRAPLTQWFLLHDTLLCVPPPSHPPLLLPPSIFVSLPGSQRATHGSFLSGAALSTMLLVWKPNKLQASPDLIKHSSRAINTKWKTPSSGDLCWVKIVCKFSDETGGGVLSFIFKTKDSTEASACICPAFIV